MIKFPPLLQKEIDSKPKLMDGSRRSVVMDPGNPWGIDPGYYFPVGKTMWERDDARGREQDAKVEEVRRFHEASE